MMTRGKMHPFIGQGSGYNRFWGCEVTNWLRFFRYNAHAARSTFGGSIQRVKVNPFATRHAAARRRFIHESEGYIILVTAVVTVTISVDADQKLVLAREMDTCSLLDILR